MFGMNQEQVKSLALKILAIAGGFVAGKWGITSGSWEAISAAVVALITVFYSFKMNTKTALVKAAETVPSVSRITVTDKKLVDITGPKVTT